MFGHATHVWNAFLDTRHMYGTHVQERVSGNTRHMSGHATHVWERVSGNTCLDTRFKAEPTRTSAVIGLHQPIRCGETRELAMADQ